MSIYVDTTTEPGYCRYMNNATNTGRHIEVPVTSTADRTWVRINHNGARVAVIPNPNYQPPTLTVDDIDLPGLS